MNFTKARLRRLRTSHIPGPPSPIFQDINVLGEDGANAGALVVDPTDPNVVFVGGSNLYDAADPMNHAFIYVDTGDMRDTNYFGIDQSPADPLNNGDDIQKAHKAWEPLVAGFFYDPPTNTDPYIGEGVYWYDLIEGASGTTPGWSFPGVSLDLLPPEITTLTFDAKGRLLVGTDGGIWRGVNNGMGYDFTSGGTGILAMGGHHGPPANNFTTAGMSFTSINGNLSISDMTGVAVDPYNVGTYYTTQVDTGGASFSPNTGWVSQGLLGPVVTIGAATFNLDIATAASILTAIPAAPGDPVVLYRIWQFANPNALVPEFSTNDGVTWTAIPGIPTFGTSAGSIPATFAINPTPLSSAGISLNQLLFGSSPLYETATSSSTWNPAGQPAGVVGLPSAAAIAPSNDQVFYVGDDHGEVWSTQDQGGVWTLAAGAASGLPTISALSPIKGITVDPNNSNLVYAMFGGATSTGFHVYVSGNGGVSFCPGQRSLGAAQAFSMVIDRTPSLGAPNGKLYLATQGGVYVSVNNGASWGLLGLGMPNVPVVDLSYQPSLHILAAATLGRGIYTINTSVISVIANQTINENTPSAPIPFTVNNAGGVAYTITATSNLSATITAAKLGPPMSPPVTAANKPPPASR